MQMQRDIWEIYGRYMGGMRVLVCRGGLGRRKVSGGVYPATRKGKCAPSRGAYSPDLYYKINITSRHLEYLVNTLRNK